MAAGGQGLIRLPDELKDFDIAQGLARMYGEDILVNFHGESQAKLIHEHIDEVAKLADNPQAAAAFFALLSPKVRDSLPNLIAVTGSKTAKQDLAAFSKALGAALNAPTLVPAFAKVRADLVKPAGSKVAAWNRLALLSGAKAPRPSAARRPARWSWTSSRRSPGKTGAPAGLLRRRRMTCPKTWSPWGWRCSPETARPCETPSPRWAGPTSSSARSTR